MKIAIVDYDMGNVASVQNALFSLGADALLTNNAEELKVAERIILPGVGAFGDGMANLRRLGLIDILSSEVIDKKKPFLGICLGMQLMAKESHEGGLHKGLGWIDGSVRYFGESVKNLKIPHVGWNDVYPREGSVLFKGLEKVPAFYFVHSYHLVCASDSVVSSTCDYGIKFTSSIRQHNLFGTQFHPEKSQRCGLKVLENFMNWSVD